VGGRGPAWTEADLETLKANSQMSNTDLGKKLGRSPLAIRAMKNKLGADACPRARPVTKWTQNEMDFVLETMDKPIGEIAVVLGRTESAVQNARIRSKRANGLHVREHKPKPERQELWELPPGIYQKMVGRILLEDEEIMGHWMHAHGFSSFEIVDEDSRGWITLLCAKVK
jgi:hypothetical protein